MSFSTTSLTTLLDGTITAADKVLNLVAGNGVPTSRNMAIRIGSEDILIDNRSGDKCFVTRGFNSTVQAAHSDGATVTVLSEDAVARDLHVTGNLSVDGTESVTGASVDGNSITADLLMATSKKLQLRDTGIFLNSGADGKATLSADGTGADDITLEGTVTVTDFMTLAKGLLFSAIARTATVAGATTGTIVAGETFISVTCDDANKIMILPAPTPGTIVILAVGANGFELRSSSPTTVAINSGTGAAAESAIPANTLVIAICQSATSWKALQLGSDGTLAKVEVAAP